MYALRESAASTVTPLPSNYTTTFGRLNVCVTGDIGLLLDIIDIKPFTISVALEGAPLSYDDCITKQGLLPLTLTNGTTYYQTCFYCANMVKTIISPSAILASNDVFVQLTQEGFKDLTLPGRVYVSPATTASSLCSSTSSAATDSTIAPLMFIRWITTPSTHDATKLQSIQLHPC